MIPWNALFETGVNAVDHDHRLLFAQLAALDEALLQDMGAVQLGETLRFLNGYVREHFQREEQIMRLVRCPAHAENYTAHSALIGRLDGWMARLDLEGATPALAAEVHRELAQWLTDHIVAVDCKLRFCRPTG